MGDLLGDGAGTRSQRDFPVPGAAQTPAAAHRVGSPVGDGRRYVRLVSEHARPPSVDRLARSLAGVGLPHPLLVAAARQAVADGRADTARARAEETARRLLQPVINATGVLVHTNLGRSPLGVAPDVGPTNLEFDLDRGRRGQRGAAVAELLRALTGAEDALVVNNGAAAVLLALSALAPGRPVVVSRGELVEIGGGFRIPDVMAQSGARLVEVGTTNRTRLADYAGAVGTHDPALVVKVHPSNYRMVGFTESVGVGALAGLGPPVLADLGSGLLDEATPWLAGGPPAWLAGEPGARQTLSQGAALVTFSGDKLLGGPQAGIVAGRADLVAACAAHPLARAVRAGGMVLVALQETLLAYLRRQPDRIPLWRMATAPLAAVRARAERVAEVVGPPASVTTCASTTGGGSLPGRSIASAGVTVPGDRRAALRRHRPPVVATVVGGRTVCDLRTVDPAHDADLAGALVAALVAGRGEGEARPWR